MNWEYILRKNASRINVLFANRTWKILLVDKNREIIHALRTGTCDQRHGFTIEDNDKSNYPHIYIQKDGEPGKFLCIMYVALKDLDIPTERSIRGRIDKG